MVHIRLESVPLRRWEGSMTNGDKKSRHCQIMHCWWNRFHQVASLVGRGCRNVRSVFIDVSKHCFLGWTERKHIACSVRFRHHFPLGSTIFLTDEKLSGVIIPTHRASGLPSRRTHMIVFIRIPVRYYLTYRLFLLSVEVL
jgi:hypothetical protein